MSLCPWDPAGQQAALRWERGVGPRETRGDVQHHVPKGTRLRATCRSTGRTPAERRAGRCSSSGQGCVRPKGQEGSEGCPEPKATCTTPGRDSRYSACREGRRAVSRAVILKPNQIPAPCGAVPLRRPQGAAGASPPPGPHRPPWSLGAAPARWTPTDPAPPPVAAAAPGPGWGAEVPARPNPAHRRARQPRTTRRVSARDTITALFPRYIFMTPARRMAFLWGSTKGLCAVLRLELPRSSLTLRGSSSSGEKPTRAPKPPRPRGSTMPLPRARLAVQPAGGGGIRWARAVPSCSSQSPDPPPHLSAEGPTSQTNK